MECNKSKALYVGGIFWSIFLLVASESLSAQTNVSVNEHAKIDSLLLCGNFAAAQQAIDHELLLVDTVHTEKAALKRIRTGLNKYQKLLEQLSLNASSQGSPSELAALETALSLEDRFRIDAAGDLGNRAYLSFKKAWTNRQISTALDFYTLSQFYRYQFFDAKEASLAASVDSVNNSLSLKKYRDALSHIHALSSSEASNPAYFKFRRALAEAQNKANDGIEEERRQKEQYAQTETFGKRWTFSFGVGQLSIGEITNSHWIFVDENVSLPLDRRFSVRSIQAVPGLLWQADASYFIDPQLSFDLRGAFSTVHFKKAVVDDENIPSVIIKKAETSASFHHSFYNLESTVRYYLQKELGIRAYLAGGIGYSLMRRPQTQTPIGAYYLDSVSVTRWSRYSSLAESESSPYAVARLGTDYMNEQSTYLLGAFIEENIYLRAVHLAGGFTTTFGIKYGLIF